MKMEKLIRALLRDNGDGLTAPEISRSLKLDYGAKAISAALKTSMSDAYIDRYKRNDGGGQYSAVWCVVAVPEHCPRPDKARVAA